MAKDLHMYAVVYYEQYGYEAHGEWCTTTQRCFMGCLSAARAVEEFEELKAKGKDPIVVRYQPMMVKAIPRLEGDE